MRRGLTGCGLLTVAVMWLSGMVSATQPAAAAESRFVALEAPVRLIDTRPGTSVVDGASPVVGEIPSDGTMPLRWLRGRGGVPADANAVVVNLTAVDPIGAGFLSVIPCSGQPDTSNLNYAAGRSVANAAIVSYASGDVCLYSSSRTHVLVDVTGYMTGETFAASVRPTRVADTRPTGQTVDGAGARSGEVRPNSVTIVKLLGRGIGAPSPVALNVTATGSIDAGYFTVYPCDVVRPNASNLNFEADDTVAAMVWTRTDPVGRVCVYSSARTQVIVDVFGTFDSASFSPLRSPQRLFDTRDGTATIDSSGVGDGLRGRYSATRIQVAGRGAVPLGTGAVSLTVTAVDPVGAGYLTVFPSGSGIPNASNVNFVGGRNAANSVIARLGSDGALCLFTASYAQVIVDVNGILPGVADSASSGSRCDTLPPPEPQPAGPLALDALSSIQIASESGSGYDRDLFAYPSDDDGDRCDTRAEVLLRDSRTPAAKSSACVVRTGAWFSPYDATTHTEASELEIDHVVSLSEAFDSGASTWTPARRKLFGNDLTDPRTLRAVTSAVNRAKGDSDPATWLPPERADWCRYLGDVIAIKARWGLTMDINESTRISDEITDLCPWMRIDVWAPTPSDPVTPQPPAPTTTTPPSPTTQPPVTQPPVTQPPRSCDPSYPTVCIPPPPPDLDCADIPYRRFTVVGADPHRFDQDNDGIGCES